MRPDSNISKQVNCNVAPVAKLYLSSCVIGGSILSCDFCSMSDGHFLPLVQRRCITKKRQSLFGPI